MRPSGDAGAGCCCDPCLVPDHLNHRVGGRRRNVRDSHKQQSRERSYSQYCWPLNEKQDSFGDGRDAATWLRKATLRRKAGALGAFGAQIRKLTAPLSCEAVAVEAGVKLTRHPPRACNAILMSVAQPSHNTATGTSQLYWPAAAPPAKGRPAKPARKKVETPMAERPIMGFTRNIERR
jgi:hypothetical protein